jgi:hypothetical protein
MTWHNQRSLGLVSEQVAEHTTQAYVAPNTDVTRASPSLETWSHTARPLFHRALRQSIYIAVATESACGNASKSTGIVTSQEPMASDQDDCRGTWLHCEKKMTTRLAPGHPISSLHTQVLIPAAFPCSSTSSQTLITSSSNPSIHHHAHLHPLPSRHHGSSCL